MWAFLRLVGSFLDFLPRALPPPCIHFRNFFPVTFIPHPSKLQSIPSIRSPSAYSLRWEKNFLITRLIVGRAHPLARWWRSVFPPLRPKTDLRNQLSVTSHFRRTVVHLAAKRETETRHASLIYVRLSKRFISFYEVICSTEHGASWYAWINIKYHSILILPHRNLIITYLFHNFT